MEKFKNISDKNPFKVPENYFDEVNKKILDSTSGTGADSKKAGLYIRLRPLLVLAASIAILIAVSYTAVRLFSPSPSKMEMIPEINFQEFSDFYLNDIDILTLEQNYDPPFMSEMVPDISKSEIIDYLLLENINENEIYELL